MLLFMFFNMFFRSAMADSFVLYGGLLMASGFVIVDTQVIIEKAESGIRDHVSDALALFNGILWKSWVLCRSVLMSMQTLFACSCAFSSCC